jgi:hypothetical protein
MKFIDTWKMYKTMSHRGCGGLTAVNASTKQEYRLDSGKRLADKDGTPYSPGIKEKWYIKEHHLEVKNAVQNV